MTKDDSVGFLILLGIIAIALFGGVKGASVNGLFPAQPMTPEQKRANLQQEISNTQYEVENLKKQIALEEDKKNASQYKGMVRISYVNRSTDPSQEYITITVNSPENASIPVTGWSVKSLMSGVSVQIPKGAYLFFSGQQNAEEHIYLTHGDTLYLTTGSSPIGWSFKSNKCSGYLNQFQKFYPYISGSCPAPRKENLSSIPTSPINDACLDYIDFFPQCRIQMEPLPIEWGSECRTFITEKINYNACINTHKDDSDFYSKEWRVYLKRSSPTWKDRREYIVLYDDVGKIVDSIKY